MPAKEGFLGIMDYNYTDFAKLARIALAAAVYYTDLLYW